MSHQNFHEHGANEIRMAVLRRADIEEVEKANPRKAGEKDDDYDKRIALAHAATGKRVDFHIFEADLPEDLRELFDQAKDARRFELIQRAGKLIKTLAQLKKENPPEKDEKPGEYKARIQQLFDEQSQK